MLLYEDLSSKIIQGFYTVHHALGSGLLEGPYHKALYLCLRNMGLSVRSQVPFIVMFQGEVVGEYLADIVVEDRIIVEVKSVQSLNNVMQAQVINYLKISGLRLGFLVNFQGINVQFKRFVNTPP